MSQVDDVLLPVAEDDWDLVEQNNEKIYPSLDTSTDDVDPSAMVCPTLRVVV